MKIDERKKEFKGVSKFERELRQQFLYPRQNAIWF